MIVRDFLADRAAALLHATAMCRTPRHVADGRPHLPRCDSPKWGDPDIVQHGGGLRPCACTSRGTPDRACPYVTRAHVAVERLASGSYVVQVTPLHAELRGTIVDVDGVAVTITDAGARTLTTLEETTRVREWDGTDAAAKVERVR